MKIPWITMMLVFAGSLRAIGNLVVSVSDAAVTEGNSGTVNAPFVISLSQPQAQAVTVWFTTFEIPGSRNVPYPARAGADFTPTNGWVTFAIGQTNKTVVVRVAGDNINEANEPFGFGLSSTTHGTTGPSARGTITDDDIMELTFNNPSVLEGHSGMRSVTVTLSTSRATEQAISGPATTFSLQNGTADEQDYQRTGGWWSMYPGPAQTNMLFGAFQVFGDAQNEDDETFFVNVGWEANNITLRAPARCTIVNDDFFLKSAKLTGNEVRLCLVGAANTAHVLQWSSDLTSWVAFKTNVLSSERQAFLNLTNQGNRFYRAVRPISIQTSTTVAGTGNTRIQLFSQQPK